MEFNRPVNRFVSGFGRQRRKEGTTMSREYKSGTYCIEVKCPKHKELEGLTGDAYLKKKIDEGLRAIIPQKETDKKKIIDIKKVPKDEYSRLINELS